MKDKIYDDYYNKLFYWSLNKTKNKENAKDLLNDIFVEIYTYLNKNIEIENIDRLIWTIAYNTWKNNVRKIIKDKKITYDEDIINNQPYNDNNVDKIMYEDIINNLNNYNLTDNEISCFRLYYKYQYDITTISNKLNLKENNIKYYLFNSRKKIKERYYGKRK